MEQRKELRELYEKKKGEEYVEWINNQPIYTLSEWVDYMIK